MLEAMDGQVVEVRCDPRMKFSFGEFELLSSRQQLLESGRPLRVGSRAFGLLQILLENAGQLVTKDQLIASVWPGVWVDETNLRVHMGALRKALGDGQSGRRFILNVPGRGYRFIEPVTKGSGAAITHPAAVEPVGNVLLPPPIRLVGRSNAVDSLSSQLSRRRMITIVGPGGIGKTSLALAVADSWSQTESTRRVFIDLSATTDPERLWGVAATAFNAEFTSEPRMHVLRSVVAAPTLIILDNCEHIIEAAAQFTETVLNVAKTTRVLATSREPLRVLEEWAHRLAPLDYPEKHLGLAASEALKFSAIALFVERVIANHDQFELTEADVPATVEICRRLGGNPLALELAAARADLFTLAQLAQGLNDRFGLLTRGRRTALGRHQTLRALLEWSYQLLSPMEQSLLRRLSVFPSTFDISDAAELALRHGAEASGYLDGVTNLVAKSMLTVDISGEAARYRFNETTRAFALEELDRAGEANDALLSLTNYMLSKLLAAPGADAQARSEWLEQCRLSLDNVRASLDWAFGQAGNLSAGLNLVMAALPVWLQLSRLVENREFLEPALKVLVQHPDRRHDQLALETSIGLSFYYSTGPAPGVIAHIESALAIARSLSAKPQELSILWMLYGISGNWGDYQAAIRFADDYALAARSLTEPAIKLKQHRILARAKHDLGNHANALLHLEQAFSSPVDRMARIALNAYEIDDITAALAVKSRVLWISGQVDDALSVAEECLQHGLKVDHAQSICWALMFNLCPVAIWRGDLALAHRFAAIASTQSEKTFEHWNDWSQMYQVALGDLDSGSNTPAFASLFAKMIPSQQDLFATFSLNFASPDLFVRPSSPAPAWCTAELMRIDAETDAPRRTKGQKEHLLRKAYRLAEEQGARSWQLRLATSIARLKQEEDDASSMRTILEPVLASFKQGYQTRDWKIAAELV
jgi:predicted ATPase/DNA-binding winged helix-turn-helix (wHTH) protein